MTVSYLNLKPVVAAIALCAVLSSAALAQSDGGGGDSTDEAALLAALAEAPADEARRIDRQLQALWGKSGSAAMDLLMKRGREALEAGDARAAIEHLTALTDHAPNFAEAWHLRASAYFEAGLVGPALTDLGRALTLNPNNYTAIYGLGAVLESLGDTDRAHAAYLRARALHPTDENIRQAVDRLEPGLQGQTL